uniref:C-type lectin domain-containing protein n=1 Tax=Capra hircus TaxID=9925 RepID=A0A8C2QQP7_CAPHI
VLREGFGGPGPQEFTRSQASQEPHLELLELAGKDLQEKCLAIISPVTPAKLCSCILIIFILVALNVVTLSALVAARSRKPDLKVLYVTCPEGWIGFGSKCFYFSEESKNWTFSQTSCTKMEAVLAQFEMEEELVRNIFGSCS